MTRTAERLLMRALARLHREHPLARGFRADVIVSAAAESASAPRPRGHRGAASFEVTVDDLRLALDELAERGGVERSGRRFWLSGSRPTLDPEMRRRADALLAALRQMGSRPAPAARLARVHGIPDAVLGFLRDNGELVSVAEGVDYPADVLDGLVESFRAVAHAEGSVSVGRFRDAIGGGRRHAVALLEHFDAIGLSERDGEARRLADSGEVEEPPGGPRGESPLT